MPLPHKMIEMQFKMLSFTAIVQNMILIGIFTTKNNVKPKKKEENKKNFKLH